MSGRPRENYIIGEFKEARLALDGYYSSLQKLAWIIERRGTQSEYDVAVVTMREAKIRLRKAIEALALDEESGEQETTSR